MHREKALATLHIARRIGVVRTDRLGDMILTLPLVAALRARFPEASIELISRRYVSDVVEGIAEINAIHYIDDQSFAYILQEQVFDALFFPRPVLSEVWAALRAGVSLRVGSAYRWYSALFSFRMKEHRKNARRHEAEYNVRMLDVLTGDHSAVKLLAPIVQHEALANVDTLLRESGIAEADKFIVIHPGSGSSAQEWSPQHFGECAAALSRSHGLKVVVSGTQVEMEKCQTAMQFCPSAVNLCGKLSLSQMIALLSRSQLLIANSTGVLHIAAALGRPVCGLYPNSPAMSAARWGPYTPLSRVLSPPYAADPQRRDLMSDIEVDVVVRASQELLDKSIH